MTDDVTKLIRERQQRAAQKTVQAQPAQEQPPAAKKRQAKPPKAKAAPSQHAPKKHAPSKANDKLEVELEPPRKRWEAFARYYVFGDAKSGVPPMNARAAYMAAYPQANANTASVNGSRLMANPEFHPILVRVAAAAWERAEASEDEVVQAWLGAMRANVFDYFSASEDPDNPGALRIDAKALNELPKPVQRNVRKLKVTNRWIPRGEGEPPTLEQRIEIEIIDRLKALDSLAKYLGLFQTELGAESAEAIAKLIAEAQARAQRRSVTWDHDEQRPVYLDSRKPN